MVDHEHDEQLDPVDAWLATVDRVCELVTDAGEEPMRTQMVPACPDWTSRELLAHMVGLGASVLADDEPDDHHAEWTQQHVDDRADRSTAELVEEWQGLADDLAAHMRRTRPRPLADATIHEHDLRGALSRPGAQDAPAMRIVRGWMLDRFARQVDDLPPIVLDAGSWTWTSAEGGGQQDVATVVRAPSFDLDRALVSRRTADELRDWTVAGDVEPFLDAFAVLGPLPETPLADG